MSRLARAFVLSFALLIAACASREYTPIPEVDALPDSVFNLYSQIDLNVAIWESVTPSPDYLRVGGTPSYIEPLRAALVEAKLFREVTVAPWRPTGGDVVLKITDAPQCALFDSRAGWNMVGTLLFAGLPAIWLRYESSIHSNILVESESADDPLQLEARQATRLTGKLLDFYGGEDARLRLAERHSRTVAARLVNEFIGRRAWFENRAAANAAPAPAEALAP